MPKGIHTVDLDSRLLENPSISTCGTVVLISEVEVDGTSIYDCLFMETSDILSQLLSFKVW